MTRQALLGRYAATKKNHVAENLLRYTKPCNCNSLRSCNKPQPCMPRPSMEAMRRWLDWQESQFKSDSCDGILCYLACQKLVHDSFLNITSPVRLANGFFQTRGRLFFVTVIDSDSCSSPSIVNTQMNTQDHFELLNDDMTSYLSCSSTIISKYNLDNSLAPVRPLKGS